MTMDDQVRVIYHVMYHFAEGALCSPLTRHNVHGCDIIIKKRKQIAIMMYTSATGTNCGSSLLNKYLSMEGKLFLPKKCEVTREFKIAMYCSWRTYLPSVENSGRLIGS